MGLLPPSSGGAECSSWLLIRQLVRMGVRVRAFAPVEPAMAGEAEEFRRAHPGAPPAYYSVPEIWRDPGQRRSGQLQVAEQQLIEAHLERSLQEEPADLVIAGREMESRGVPAVAERHRVPWLLRCGGYTLHLLQRGMLAPTLRAAVAASIRRASATIVQARHLSSVAEECGCTRVHVIPNMVDLRDFAPRPRPSALCGQLDIPTNARIVMHASNLKPVKRAIDLVESAHRLLAAQPDLVYVVAGDGLDRLAMEKRCQSLGIAYRFRFLGRVAYDWMPEVFALADMVVMCSEFEQQSRVYLEAQASGRLLISSDVAGAREVVEDGMTGLLYPAGDAGELAALTQRALDDRRLGAAIEERALARVQAHSLDKIAARVTALMEDVVSSYRTAHV